MIKGITVTLVDRVKTGEDEMGAATYDDVEIQVENVLVSPTEATDVINQVQLYGKKAVYTLGIPKGDTHNWEDREVKFFGKTFRTFGPVVEGIEFMVPTDWHKKVTQILKSVRNVPQDELKLLQLKLKRIIRKTIHY